MTSTISDSLKRFSAVTMLVLAPALALAAPARTYRAMDSAANSPALGGAPGALDFSAQLALDIPPSGYSVGPRFTGEVMYNLMDLAPQLRLSLGGRGSFAVHGGDFVSLWLIEGVPDAKIKFAVNDIFAVYGDFGLGLAIIHSSVDFAGNIPGSTVSTSDDTLAVAIQFGGGVSYAISPTINLLGELRFNVYTRDGSSTFIALPTVGVQWH
jgi:opacity protein-like surface antigen